MELHFNISGTILIMLSLVHVIFPRYFDWKTELKHLSLINRQVMVVHTFFIAFVVMLMGILCLSSSSELLHTEFGRKISLGLAVFWFCRLIIQFFGYSPQLWRGKKFETIVHIFFSIIWAYLTWLFTAAFLGW